MWHKNKFSAESKKYMSVPVKGYTIMKQFQLLYLDLILT